MDYNIDVIALLVGIVTVVAMFVKIQVDITYIQKDLLKLNKKDDDRGQKVECLEKRVFILEQIGGGRNETK